MKNRQIALIRGINVGPAKRVAMADLRALLEELGYADVRTLLNSGNAVFQSAGPSPESSGSTAELSGSSSESAGSTSGSDTSEASRHIEDLLKLRTGVSAKVIVLTAAELYEIIAANPLTNLAADPSRLLVAVFSQAEDRQLIDPLAQQDWASEALAIGSRAAYLWCPDGVIASRVSAAVNQILGDRVTSRNWTTMLKISALCRGQDRPSRPG